jgi:hypothetical protein
MAITLSAEQFAALMSKMTALEQKVSAPAAPVFSLEKKPRKPRSADAKPNLWILFTNRVRSTLAESGHKLGKECQQFCASLKEENADFDSWTAEDILDRFSSWEKPEVSKMKAAGVSFKKPKMTPALAAVAAALASGLNPAAALAAAAAAPVAEKKPRAPLSAEHLAKLKAGREAAKAQRDAEKALLATLGLSAAPSAPAPAPSAPLAAAASAPVFVPSAPAAPAASGASEWRPIKLKTASGFAFYLWNPQNNQTYKREADGSQGEWAGILDPKTKTIDSSIPEPDAEEEESMFDL